MKMFENVRTLEAFLGVTSCARKRPGLPTWNPVILSQAFFADWMMFLLFFLPKNTIILKSRRDN